MQKLKTQKGITLIALIITIIVMLILVGVSVTVALNGGLFSTAQNAADRTKAERDNEIAISNGDIISQYVTENESGTDIVYATGTEVTIGETEENFYVIKDEGAKLVLLSKYNLKENEGNWTQDTSGGTNAVQFYHALQLGYWSTQEEELEHGGLGFEEWCEKYGYPKDLNEYEECPQGTPIDIAKQYAENTIENGATGRLMTYEEAYQLSQSTDENIKKILYGDYNDGSYLYYWLGTAVDFQKIYSVWIEDGISGTVFNLERVRIL